MCLLCACAACECCTKCLSPVFKFILWICSILLFCIGVALLVVSLVAFYDQSYFNFINTNPEYYWVYAVAWAFAAVVIFNSLVGCASTCHDVLKVPCLGLFLFLNICMIAGSAAYIGVDWYGINHLNTTFYDYTSNLTLSPTGDHYTELTNYQQKNFCCGFTSQDRNGDKVCYQWQDNVPQLCNCTVGLDAYCESLSDSKKFGCQDFNSDYTSGIFSRGCYDQLYEDADDVLQAIGITMIVTLGLTCLAAIFGLALCCCG